MTLTSRAVICEPILIGSGQPPFYSTLMLNPAGCPYQDYAGPSVALVIMP